jgi:hypothetical protein
MNEGTKGQRFSRQRWVQPRGAAVFGNVIACVASSVAGITARMQHRR